MSTLKRQVGIGGAVLLGLGSMVGTGVFVSIGIAAGIAGPAVVIAIVIAGLLATCNGLSSAQLAASHPVAGGTYEYGYRYLTPALGFTAGWTFLLAKSASAATAALGVTAYLQTIVLTEPLPLTWQVMIAIGALIILTACVLGGVKRSNVMNLVIVSITISALTIFAITCFASDQFAPASLKELAGISGNASTENGNSTSSSPTLDSILAATALMFVAYTGYGRVATMGEEINEPQKNIPRAVIITLIVTAFLYITIALAVVGVTDVTDLNDMSESSSKSGGPVLSLVGNAAVNPTVDLIVSIGALTAMLGVLLNLILGLSRVALAMGRRRDLPRVFANVSESGTTPVPAVLLVAGIIAILICIGDIKTTWSFSAFTVLIYYAIANLTALRLKGDDHRYPHIIAGIGLVGCLCLAFFVPMKIWLTGGGLILVGLIWHWVMQRRAVIEK